jgi:hypothetical protein
MMQEEFSTFERMLAEAASRVGALYFQLPVAQLADAIYRERVYCYELYHQLRIGWGAFGFSLGGEVDKSGHPLFRCGPYAQAKPDLLVHEPGNMGRNLACVEVKPCIRPVAEFAEDLKKLTWFCHHAEYYRGIFLVYGADEHETPDLNLLRANLREAAQGPDIDRERICLIHHRRVGEQAARIQL